MPCEKIINVSKLIKKYDNPVFQEYLTLFDVHNIKPQIAVILTSNDLGCISYTKGIRKFCENYNILCNTFQANSASELENLIHKLNKDENIHGIMIMYPTNFGVKDTYFMNLVFPEKDVEGLTYYHLGFLVQFEKFKDAEKLKKFVIPPTAKGILSIFKRMSYNCNHLKKTNSCNKAGFQTNPFIIEGKKITIINDSLAVGRSLALMLLNENGSVEVCHKFTSYKRIIENVKNSDIIVSAVPSKNFIIPTSAVPEKAIVIDISFEGNFEYPSVIDKCFKIAPRWDLVEKGNRINDMTLNRLISNLFYLIEHKIH